MQEIEKGTKALNIAEEIFNIRYSNGEGDDVVIELLSHDFVYDYEDYKKAILLLKPEQIVKVTIMQAIGDEYKSVVVEVNVGSAK